MQLKFKYPSTSKKGQYLLTFFVFLFASFSGNCFGQTKDSIVLSSLIKKNNFTYANNNFEGNGWDLLKKEVEKAQFVMIGEQHGEAEIPVFTGKIASIFKPKAFVAEIDPYTAERLKEVAKHPEKDAEHFKKWPYDLAFYSWETEMKLARQLRAEHVDIWGLNEITFISTGLFFEKLAAVAKIPANKALAKQKSIEYGDNDRPLYYDSNKWTNLSFFKLTTGYIDTLLLKFKNDNKQSQKMLLDLKVSRPLLWDNYPMRVSLMKKNFLNYVAPYIGKDSVNFPKLLFKFGANHVTRTDDLKGIYEVGNLADNLAAAAGKKTLHILIFGKNGTINSMLSPDNNVAIKPYKVEDDEGLSMFKPFYSQVNDQEWTVFDLRPIRTALKKGKLKGSSAELNDFILGYDLLVLFSPVTGNKFIQ